MNLCLSVLDIYNNKIQYLMKEETRIMWVQFNLLPLRQNYMRSWICQILLFQMSLCFQTSKEKNNNQTAIIVFQCKVMNMYIVIIFFKGKASTVKAFANGTVA